MPANYNPDCISDYKLAVVATKLFFIYSLNTTAQLT